MTAPAGFEPTLDIPLAWIEELTGIRMLTRSRMRLLTRFSARFVKEISEFIFPIRIHSGVARIVLNCFHG